MNKQLALATMNPGKLVEIQTHLKPLGFQVQSQVEFNMPDTPETGETFVENAILKARALAKVSGLPTLADDSGLAVDALGGRPGVYSARYAGEPASRDNNITQLLGELAKVPDEKRTAKMYCIMVLMRCENDPAPLIAQAHMDLLILKERAADGGFGYDPVLYSPEHGVCLAALSAEQKNAISHRGLALTKMLNFLK